MTMAVPSSEASSSPSKRGLRGPRPQPLKVSSSSRGSSPTSKPSSSKKAGAAPVIVYEHTPKVVHARPQEFMTVVQRLTGKPAPNNTASSMPYAPSFSPAAVEEGSDPLLLTLGQRQAAPVLPSPMAAGLLMSPGFVFSPNTMQSIQELSPFF
ncbi:VQ motif-containing protein 8, chloroplastic-like [Phragmites australis]|uniref:VQ motif-containing protein 8, chloroplastic-like n=1 Tax=Phragmites australis TaxID=29695 RepID=UPI002D77ACF1|nr:VQ motif-containing protein 8, chloroplastic-like [Phragmites australis]